MSIDFYQKAIARKIGNTFRMATENEYDIVDFIDKWLSSDVSKRIWEENPIDIAQWAPYQLDSLLIELEENGISLKKSDELFPDEMYWMGYLLTYWGFDEQITGPELKQYDIVWIFNQYDTLHTTSIEYAINSIKEHHEYEQNKKEILNKE